MTTDLAIACSCGALKAAVRGLSARGCNRAVCYCDDCQAFAHFLGRPDEIIDQYGGTEVLQLSSAYVEFAEGTEQLACMRLKAGGLLRWYADCCRTPIGNTLPTHQVPFVGLVHLCIHLDDDALGAVLGPVRARVHGKFAKGKPSGVVVHDGVPVSYLLRVAAKLLTARLRGDHKRSAFFDPNTGLPRVVPHVLTVDERRAVEKARDAR